jgi:hypothetical protein
MTQTELAIWGLALGTLSWFAYYEPTGYLRMLPYLSAALSVVMVCLLVWKRRHRLRGLESIRQ